MLRTCLPLACSLKGVSEVLASLFIAEVRCVEDFKHPGAIAKLAGMNLKVSDSGTYRGRRRLSHLGNPRLRWVIFSMASQAATHVPEVRAKYLRRCLKHPNRTKNVVACVPTLLSLITTMVREQRPYYYDPSTEAEVILSRKRSGTGVSGERGAAFIDKPWRIEHGHDSPPWRFD